MIDIHIDGASKGNNSKVCERRAYTCLVVPDRNEVLISERGNLTNNEAEWDALIEALFYIKSQKIKEKIRILSDSQLVVNQYNDEYKIKNVSLKFRYEHAKRLVKLYEIDLILKWIPREENYAGHELERRFV